MDTKPLYLNGSWVDAGPPLEVIDPATGDVTGAIATTDAGGVRQAIDDAHRAFPAWRGLTAIQRADYLLAVAGDMRGRLEEIAAILTRENGKPISQSRTEVLAAVDHFRWFAEEARRAYGRTIPNQAGGKRHLVLQHPIGVVGAIAPWNFPLMLAARKIAPAMAAGCPVILKPASATPLTAVALAECMDRAGIPPGVFQFVAGKASDIGRALLAHPDCRKISFTGSTEVGRTLLAGAAATMTKLSLELGGQAPFLVFDDAGLDAAVEGLLVAKFRNTGQSCIAANRVYLQRGIHDAFVESFTAAVRGLKVGNGMEEDVDIGALIDADAITHAQTHIQDATRRGACLVCGGEWHGTTGFFLEPAVLTDVPDDALCMTEETFAPVTPIAAFDTEEEAVRRANHTRYGLAAYAYTENLNRGLRLAESLEAGSVCINDSVPSVSPCPFGGFKESGMGRELGLEGIAAYLEPKHVAIGNVGG